MRGAWLLASVTCLLACAGEQPRGQEVAVLVHLKGRASPGKLKEYARRRQSPLLELLANRSARQVQPLWLVNAIALTATPELLQELARHPDVERIELDRIIRAPEASRATTAAKPGWNLTAIHARELWKRGYRGKGVIVANMDTGVDVLNKDLGYKWRGVTATGWFDPFRNTRRPYDPVGHGTQTMGVIAGGSGNIEIGVAPEVTWIAAKVFDDSQNSSVSIMHRAFQWLLDGRAVHQNPIVVNASWDLPAVNGCDLTFSPDLAALRAAGILVVFAAGNSGPLPLTSESPANAAELLSVGAIDSALGIAPFSSRGPSACSGGIFPSVVAPGVNIRTTAISLGGKRQYEVVSGTSFAAPHVAGAAALLLGAFPRATIAQVEASLRSTAHDLGTAGADDTYGNGVINIDAAYLALAAQIRPGRGP